MEKSATASSSSSASGAPAKKRGRSPSPSNLAEPFSVFGIEFAPLKIPTRRRLETLAVLYVVINFFFALIHWAALFYLIRSDYYYLGLLYIAWVVYDRDRPARGARLWRGLRSLAIWKYYASYFPITLEKTEELDPNRNYIFGYHPHGIMSYGAFGHFATDGTGFSSLFPGITPYLVTLKVNFWTPFHRDLALLRGIIDSSKESINWMLQRMGSGNAVVIVLGGAAESLDAVPNTMKLTLKSRKGFIKLAIQNGASVVPVISFGENEIFSQAPHADDSFVRRFQKQMKYWLTFTFPIFHGRGVFQYSMGLMPYRKPIHTIVGAPIHLEKNLKPTQEEIDSAHAAYVKGLTDIFNANKGKYAQDPHLELELQ